MVVKRYDNKIIQAKTSGSERLGNTWKVNIIELARDIKANGAAYVRSREVAEQLREYDEHISYIYNKDDGLFEMYYSY